MHIESLVLDAPIMMTGNIFNVMFNVSSCDYLVSVFLESTAKPSAAAQAWLGRRFKNHCLPTRVVGRPTGWNQDGEL